jgi:hypothetical protein
MENRLVTPMQMAVIAGCTTVIEQRFAAVRCWCDNEGMGDMCNISLHCGMKSEKGVFLQKSGLVRAGGDQFEGICEILDAVWLVW